MPYQGKMQQQAPEDSKKARPEEQFIPKQSSFGIPNSARMSTAMTPPAGTPNSVMREMETEDSGSLFRGRGFDTSVGAHELSHAVRRASVPSGTIQRDTTTTTTVPDDEDEEPALPFFDFQEDSGNSQQADSNTLSTDPGAIFERLNSVARLRRVFAGPNTKKALDALQSKMALEKNPQAKARLRGILNQASEGRNILNDWEGNLMRWMNAGHCDSSYLAAVDRDLNTLDGIARELNAALGDEENDFAVLEKDDDDDFEVVNPTEEPSSGIFGAIKGFVNRFRKKK